MVRKLLVVHANETKLTVCDEEHQKASDNFRSQHGLYTVEKTRQWLDNEKLSVDDFENGLEQQLLIDKFIDHVTRDRSASHLE